LIQLLREHQVAAEFRKARKKAKSSVVAVPFWGVGAVAALGLSKKAPVRIVCNLDQPGCNPDVIAEIHSLRIKVRTHPRLHAKIYATPDFAIVGSSNVSTNGMTVEGSASKGWIEANVSFNDLQFVNKVIELFEEIWDSPEALPVTVPMIKAAIANRAFEPSANPIGFHTKTLLAAYRENPKAFGSIYVAAYTENLLKNAAKMLSAVRRGAVTPKPGLTVSDFRKAWGYQMGDIPEGAWLIDLNCRQPDKVKVTGCSQATGLRLQPIDEPMLTIALRRPVTIDGREFRISAAEKTDIASIANKIAKVGYGRIPLSDVIKMIDGVKPKDSRKKK
jgi:hypothetical protein